MGDKMLCYDPKQRITPNEALQHQWFQIASTPKRPKELILRSKRSKNKNHTDLQKEINQHQIQKNIKQNMNMNMNKNNNYHHHNNINMKRNKYHHNNHNNNNYQNNYNNRRGQRRHNYVHNNNHNKWRQDSRDHFNAAPSGFGQTEINKKRKLNNKQNDINPNKKRRTN